MKRSHLLISLLVAMALLLGLSAFALAAGPLDSLLTTAESSNWTTTTSSDDVIAFCETVAANSGGRIRLEYTYTTPNGNQIPVLVIGKPAPSGPEAVDPDKAVVYINCNIHSGEVEGKEAMLIFAREVALGQHDDLLQDLVIVLCPNSSPDGNDNLGKNRITTQFTPKLVGTRVDGQNLNMNRDMTKLDSVCARSIVDLVDKWDPVLFIDAHATDGSYMRHAITYNWGLNAGTDPELLAYNRDVFCERALRSGSYLESQGKVAIPYGNWGYYYSDIVAEGWRTFEDYARYTTNYAGLRNRLALLLEVYSYDEFSVRVDTQYECIYGALQVVAKDKAEIKALIAAADARSLARATEGVDPVTDIVALNSEMTILKLGGNDKLTVLSYATDAEGKVIGTRLYDEEGDPYAIEYGAPTDYQTDYWGTFVPTDYEVMGAYYLVDADCVDFIDTMLFHGVQISRLEADLTLKAGAYQWYDVNSFTVKEKIYEGHYQDVVDGEWTAGAKAIVIPAGTYVISTAQSLGSFAAMMLEPACVDGGVSWNYFDGYMDAKAGCFRANYTSQVAGLEHTLSLPILKLADFGALSPSTDYLNRMSFYDVSIVDWYYDAVRYAYFNGLFQGTGATAFSPAATMTREQLITVLYRMAGSPAVTGSASFSDVAADAPYAAAVSWAVENKLVAAGDANAKFGVGQGVTREQFAVILHRYAQYKALDVSATADLSAYSDAASVSAYALEAFQWACGAGVIGGVTETALAPQTQVTRAQMATMLMRFAEGPAK